MAFKETQEEMKYVFNQRLFTQDAAEVLREILNNSPHKATGYAAYSVDVKDIDSETTAIVGASYIPKIETGNPPEPSKPMPEMIRDIEEWSMAKNLEFDKAAIMAISRSIIRTGTLTYKKGGEDVYTTQLQQWIKDHIHDSKYYTFTIK